MRTIWACLLVLSFVPGCASGRKSKPRSAAHIYEGDAPTIKMTDTQSAGGELKPY